MEKPHKQAPAFHRGTVTASLTVRAASHGPGSVSGCLGSRHFPDWKRGCSRLLLQRVWSIHGLGDWTLTPQEATESLRNMQVKDDAKPGLWPPAACEDLAETNGTREPFVIKKLEFLKKSP